MIATPKRRIVLSESQHGRIEILVLGEPEAVALEFAAVRTKLEAWHGWNHVGVLVMGMQAIGLRADVGITAAHLDPIAEWWRMCSADRSFLQHVRWHGTVGEW